MNSGNPTAGVGAIDGAWASKRANTRVQQVTMLRSVPLIEAAGGMPAGSCRGGSDQF